ncbi:hypothetical protein PoB_001139300 [Plakobranchus ocellatus]|uniref:Uncharacterized protein n=1 Tax=Plakobranchus ocellatus TaxID=259542 RepID=A0AAV3YQS1_9GAST|nr:hypothetical protein PoB_001139300 [Plakobranchus ocellatus]
MQTTGGHHGSGDSRRENAMDQSSNNLVGGKHSLSTATHNVNNNHSDYKGGRKIKIYLLQSDKSVTTCSQERPRLFSKRNKIGMIPLLQRSRQSVAPSDLPLSRGLNNQSQRTHTKLMT